jgi:hypothetical protein
LAYSRFTVFGAVLWELMATRGIRGHTELCRLLSGHGHDFTTDQVRKWATGTTSANKAFPSAFAKVLGLDDKERARLADAFTYRQDEIATFD